MANDKKILRILNNLNSGIAEIGNHILFMFKILALSILLTLMASFFIAARGWGQSVGILLLIVNAIIVIYSIYSLYLLSVKLKGIEKSNDNDLIEILKDTK
jgi:hypothetical protein